MWHIDDLIYCCVQAQLLQRQAQPALAMAIALVGQIMMYVQVFVMRPCLGSAGYQEPIRADQSTYSKAAAWLGSSTSVTNSAGEGPAWATIGARRLVKAMITVTLFFRTLKYGNQQV